MDKTFIVVDVESNGPIPGEYSMTQLGAVVVDDNLDKTFNVNIKPISEKTDENRIVSSHLIDAFDAKAAIKMFKDWLVENVKGKPIFVSDNNGFDWMFVCWYFWHFLNENPFGYNSTNLNSYYKGMKKDLATNIDELREKELSHDALQDAIDTAKIFNLIIEI
jgi:DNA polymerase III alpha subunit (gram-positive type)